MKQLSAYIGYIVGILGFAGIIWTYASKSADNRYSVTDLKKDVVEIQNNMATKQDFQAFIIQSQKTDSSIIRSHNALQQSWKMYVKSHTRDYDSLMKYFQGIEFEIVIPGKPEYKIKIEKKEND